MAPVFFALLLQGNDLAAGLLFAFAAATDFVDGLIARTTHSVSRLGQLLDPAVDRVLMICAVIGLVVVNRIPLWIVILVLVRDAVLLVGQEYLLRTYHERIAVIFPGKVATTFLFVGLAGLLINTPQIAGLGLVDVGWLPGFNAFDCSWGIWFVYIGLIIGVFTTIFYVKQGIAALKRHREVL
ncbi:MAG: CDP-alcohol phosphatidyltransferase family protein [Eggerthellaceae bacterium]|nr:CDP-alcohol phosphatidyltransferase family protein [Eggerthellaceae bacterium]